MDTGWHAQSARESSLALRRSAAEPQQNIVANSEQLAQVSAYQEDSSHPTSGFNGVVLALHMCESVDVYGFGTPRDKFFSPPRAEKAGSQHLYRTEMRWLLGKPNLDADCEPDPDTLNPWPSNLDPRLYPGS